MNIQIYGIQIIGAIFLLAMMYFTFISYKQDKISKSNFVFWIGVWVIVLGLLAYPRLIYGIMDRLTIYRTLDFFVVCGLVFFSIMIFYHNLIVNKMKKQIETIVWDVALYRGGKK